MNSGLHQLELVVVKDLSQIIYEKREALALNVLDMDKRTVGWYGKEPGAVAPLLNWRTERVVDAGAGAGTDAAAPSKRSSGEP